MAPAHTSAASGATQTRRRPSLSHTQGLRSFWAAKRSARAGSSLATFSRKISIFAPHSSWMSGQGLPSP